MISPTTVRLNRLLGFLDADPRNPQLIGDAAAAALADGRFSLASDLVTRYSDQAPPPPTLVNLAGLAAMAEGRFADAAENFEAARAATPDDPVVAYNLAWAKGMQKDWSEASDLIDDAVALAVPESVRLRVQALHHLGRLDEALAWGRCFAEREGVDAALLGALSAVAMDLEDLQQAEEFARRGEASPDARTTLGMLHLAESRLDEAATCFEAVLTVQPGTGRALLGRGLEQLQRGEPAACDSLDRAAHVFGDHVGSWLAAGWAHVVHGDSSAARARFDTALTFDATFAEAHGALAVVAIMDGRLDEARVQTQVALRLDRLCFSGILARSLLLDAAGEKGAAQTLRDAAMGRPIGPSGQTITQALVTLGARRK